ncbi:MAG: radical SAM protein [Bacilli bacterium]|nr:radical SAM protein [Bacilli bacterium]
MSVYHTFEKFYAFFAGKKPRRKRFNFEVHLTDSCNLNCKGYFHFAPLARQGQDYPLDEFEQEMERLGQLFGGKFGWVRLMGGEPLLNPKIQDYLRACRRHIQDGQVDLVTNGTLLMKMSDSFFECCKENHICITVTRFPFFWTKKN